MKIAQDKIKILVFQGNLIYLRSYQSIEMKPLSLKNIKTLKRHFVLRFGGFVKSLIYVFSEQSEVYFHISRTVESWKAKVLSFRLQFQTFNYFFYASCAACWAVRMQGMAPVPSSRGRNIRICFKLELGQTEVSLQLTIRFIFVDLDSTSIFIIMVLET